MVPLGNAYKETTCGILRAYGNNAVANNNFTYSMTTLTNSSSYFTWIEWITRTTTTHTILDQTKMYFSADNRHTDGSSNTCVHKAPVITNSVPSSKTIYATGKQCYSLSPIINRCNLI